MTVLLVTIYVLVAAGGAAVVLARDVQKQAMVLSFYGMLLTILFLVLQAPDVALSELAVGAAGLPLILMAAVAKIEGNKRQ